jgi:hypothetical protein
MRRPPAPSEGGLRGLAPAILVLLAGWLLGGCSPAPDHDAGRPTEGGGPSVEDAGSGLEETDAGPVTPAEVMAADALLARLQTDAAGVVGEVARGVTVTQVNGRIDLAEGTRDQPGFWVQADGDGPGAFVAADLGRAQGSSVVAFTIVATETVEGRAIVAGIEDLVVLGRGDLEALTQRVAAADLASGVADFDGERVRVTATIADAPRGDPIEGLRVAPLAVSGEGRLALRGTRGDFERWDLEAGCEVEVVGVARALGGAIAPQAVQVAPEGALSGTCPTVFEVRDVEVLSETALRVSFTRPIDPASLDAARMTLTGASGDRPLVDAATAVGLDALQVTLSQDTPLSPTGLYELDLGEVLDHLGGVFRDLVPVIDDARIDRELQDIGAASAGVQPTPLPVAGAIVTYLRPSVGDDPRGFYVQGDADGPGLFVAVNPLGLTPNPLLGDRVAFAVTETVGAGPAVRAVAIEGYRQLAEGASLEPLRAALTTATVADAGRLATLTGRTSGALRGSGPRHLEIPVDTGLEGPDVRFRFADFVVDAIGARAFEGGCTLAVGPAPLFVDGNPWVYAQALSSREVRGTCAAPFEAIAAGATGLRSIEVRFSRGADDATLDPEDFRVTRQGSDVALEVTGAFGFGTRATVTLAANLTPATYIVSVTGVESALGEPIAPAPDPSFILVE